MLRATPLLLQSLEVGDTLEIPPPQGSVVWGPGRGALGWPLWELPPSPAPPGCMWGGGHTTWAMFWILDILLSV